MTPTIRLPAICLAQFGGPPMFGDDYWTIHPSNIYTLRDMPSWDLLGRLSGLHDRHEYSRPRRRKLSNLPSSKRAKVKAARKANMFRIWNRA